MKLKLALMLGLMAAILVPVGYSHADAVDPVVIVNRGGDAQTFTTNSISNPVIIALDANGLLPLTSFQYTGTTDLTSLYIAFSGALPFEQFTCHSDIFSACGFVNTVGTNLSDDVELFFTDGVLRPGESFTVEVTTPEPGTIALLLAGALPLFWVGKRFALSSAN